jgi:hypothetical protein
MRSSNHHRGEMVNSVPGALHTPARNSKPSWDVPYGLNAGQRTSVHARGSALLATAKLFSAYYKFNCHSLHNC